MTVFSFNGQGQVRTIVDIDGNSLFCGKDVCDILGYKDTVNAIKQHCRGVVFHHPIVDSLGRTQEARFLTEPDLYRLIAGSQLPAAQAFEAWIFEEVLPTIRKTGQYKATTANMTSNEFVSREFAALRSMAITAGLEGNAATVSANNAMVRIHSVSPLKLLQIELKNPDQQLFLTPTQIAQRLGFSGPREVNKLLAHEGFQSNINGTWVPTDKGREYVVLLDTGKRHSDGVMIQQMKWKEKICDKLKPKRQSL